ARVPLPPYEPNVPEPTTRADLMKYWVPVSLDDRTAQKLLWISEGGAKVPERYEHSPQVLCKQNLLGHRAYWEVDYDGLGGDRVVCQSAPRKATRAPSRPRTRRERRLLGAGWSGSCYQAWHNGENVDIQLPQTSTIGVYVDQPAGMVKFLLVEGDGDKEVQLLHKFRVNVREKVFPGFWVGTNSSA
uniref:Zgc:195001 n=1 Tax=Takifugu rubripes TaxID=31033 RepID=A0A3B5JYV3_TAKRU